MSRFTPNQARAIQARGNVLVQAGAGAGKTRTLIERCVAWLEEDARHSLDDILVVTFTEAAATEMRARLHTELSRRAPPPEHPSRWTEQLALLDTAQISTLHSFCLQVVRDHFYELNLDPELAVMPVEEARLLEQEVLEEQLAEHYARAHATSESVLQWIEREAHGDEQVLRQLVLKIHEWTQTLPNPAHWFQTQRNRLNQAEPVLWREWLLEVLPAWRTQWLVELARVPTAPAVAQCQSALRQLPGVPSLAQAGQMLAAIAAADTPEFWPRGSKQSSREPITPFFTEAKQLHDWVVPPPTPAPATSPPADPLQEDWEWSRGPMLTLLHLAEDFAHRFSTRKRELGAVDFHDLEQFTLQLLWDSSAQAPTELAQIWRDKFHLVFVDEYQDINAVQDAVLQSVARDGSQSNRFLVGDVKQAIYGFRLADPRIFGRYAAAWSTASPHAQVIPLSENFRSHEAILEWINPLFQHLFRADIGGIAFGPDAWLQFGHPSGRSAFTRQAQAVHPDIRPAPTSGPRVEWHLLLEEPKEPALNSENEPNESVPGVSLPLDRGFEREARIIGERLQALRQSGEPIWDETLECFRPATWRDMVVLLRSRRGKTEILAKAFQRLQIPMLASRGGFLHGLEVLDLLNVLRLLDNPRQDVPLLGVLRSPIVGLSVDDLASIRLAAKGEYWTALQTYHRQARPSPTPSHSHPPPEGIAWPRVDRFLERFHRWRHLARQGSLSLCLEQILGDTHYESWIQAEPRGDEGVANIRKLLTWTRQFDQFQRQGLFRFLQFVEAQQEAEIDHEPAPPDARDAVRVMTIHQSKGLEFPIVVVADLGKPFNLQDLRANVILDERYGLCPYITPPHQNQRYPSLPHWLAARRKRVEVFGEEIRILYVAFTRASQHLLLSGRAKRSAAEDTWPTASTSTHALLRAVSPMDWLGPYLLQSVLAPASLAQTSGESPVLRWQLYRSTESLGDKPAPTTQTVGPTETPSLSTATIQSVIDRVTWAYPWVEATTQAAKASVSALRRQVRTSTSEETFPLRFVPPELNVTRRRPSGRSGTEIGSVHHTFLEHLNLTRTQSLAELQEEAAALAHAQRLTADDLALLDFPALLQFWLSPVGQTIRTHASHVHREIPFTARWRRGELIELLSRSPLLQAHARPDPKTAASITPTAPEHRGEEHETQEGTRRADEEWLVVQGVVDLAVILPDEIWLLDFKTDRCRPAELAEKTRHYAPQLQLYAGALSQIYQRPVTQQWLHFLTLQHTVTPTALEGISLR